MQTSDTASVRTVDDWKLLLRSALRDAMRTKDASALSVVRETLAALDNAEAADPSLAPAGQSEVIAGAVVGLGAGEVARRQLSPEEATSIIEREVRERREAAASYTAFGRADEAATLTHQSDVLAALLLG